MTINNTDMHPLLQRQLRRLKRRSKTGKINSNDLLALVNQRYIDADLNQRRLEHSISVSAKELGTLYAEAKQGKQAAEDASLSKSLFLANMSHEIRTPLNGVLGFASLLLSTELSETQSEYLNIIQSSGKSLLFLLNDILDLSKIESGKVMLEETSFSLHSVIGASVDIFRGQLSDHPVDMNTYIDPQLARAYMGDPERITQIVTNFVSNALKFTHEGSIGIEVLSGGPEVDGVQPMQIRVMDTGIGITEEKQELIFEKFAQADLSTTREFGGTGLGLAISRHLAELMGGYIALESEFGVGSTFILNINLPRSSQDAGTIISSFDTAALEGKEVLVVDDTAINRRYFEAQLRDYGMECTAVDSYDTALKHLSENNVDIIITDHLMPGKDGIALIKAIKAEPHLRGIPIILSSSSGTARAQFPDAGYDALVAKPVVQKTLLDKLNHLLSGEVIEKNEPIRPQNNKTRILVAEDNLVNQRLLQQALSAMDYIVDIVSNGQEAVRAIKTLHYDMILMDIRMPDMDGVEATQKIRALNIPNADIPIIALTANAETGIAQKYIEKGMSDYLAKPFDLDRLQDVIRKWENVDIYESLSENCMSAMI